MFVYYGTLHRDVDKLQSGIRLRPDSGATDFTASDRPAAFYLSPNRASAARLAVQRAKHVSGGLGDAAAGAPVVVKYELDVKGLRVHTFGIEMTGRLFDEWQAFVANNLHEKASLENYSGYDIITGYRPDSGEDSEPKSIKVWGIDDTDTPLTVQVAILTQAAVDKLTWVDVSPA